jgi:hypothetical protein
MMVHSPASDKVVLIFSSCALVAVLKLAKIQLMPIESKCFNMLDSERAAFRNALHDGF